MDVIFKVLETEEKSVKCLYCQVKNLIDVLREKEVGCKMSSSIDKKLLKKLFIMLENDGIFVDEDNKVIIWDKNTAQRYNEQITFTCKRVCSKKEKGTCPGCLEYISQTSLNGYFLKEKIFLKVS